MARDKGYLAKIGADVSGFSEAMKQIKQETSAITKELSQVNHALKMDPENTTLQAQKLELLRQRADAAAREMQELARAREIMERVGNDGTQEGAAALREYEREIARCTRQMREFQNYQQQMGNGGGNNIADLANTTDSVTESLDEATIATGNWADVFKGSLLSGVVMQGLEMLLGMVQQIGTEVLTTGRNFETAMSQISANLGIDKASEEYNAIAVAAQHMGATTRYNAEQAVNALDLMTTAGFGVKDSIASLPTVLNLATASREELSRTTELLNRNTKTLGIVTADMNEEMKAAAITEYADKLSAVSRASQSSITSMSEGIEAMGTMAGSLSGGMDEMLIMLAAMQDIGRTGSDAGSDLMGVLSAIRDNADVFESMNVNLYDLKGNMRTIPDILTQVNNQLRGLSTEERNNALIEIFGGGEDLQIIEGLLSVTTERFNEFREAVANSEGTCANIAETLNDNLDTAITTCTNSLQNLFAAFYDDNNMQEVVEGVKGIIDEMTEGMSEGDIDEAQLAEITNKISDYILKFSEELKGKINTLGMEIIPVVLSSINENIQDISNCGTDIIMVLLKGLVNSLPYLIDGAYRLVGGLVEGIGESLPELLPVCLDVVGKIADNLVDNIDIIYQSALSLIEGLGEALSNPETLESLATAAGKIVAALFEALVYSVDLAVNIIFDVIDALAKGMARGVTDYDWTDFGDTMVDEVGKAIVDAFERMTAIKIPFVAEAEIEYTNWKGEKETIQGYKFTSSTNPDDWASMMSDDVFNDTFGVVAGPDTSALGNDYINGLTQKTKSELEQLAEDIIIERNNADAAWQSFVDSGYGNIELYLAKSKEALDEEQQAILTSIAETAKTAAITENEAYKQLYSSLQIAEGQWSKSYLEFLAVQDTIIAGTYAEEPEMLKGGTVTKAVKNSSSSSRVSTKYDDIISERMRALADEFEAGLWTEKEYFKEREKVLIEYHDTESKLWNKHSKELTEYYDKQRNKGKYDEDLEKELSELETELGKHLITEERYWEKRVELLEQYKDESSLLWHKYNDETQQYLDNNMFKTAVDDDIEKAMSILDYQFETGKRTEDEYYAKRVAILRRFEDRDSVVWWKYHKENEAYYEGIAEDAEKAAEDRQKEIVEQIEKSIDNAKSIISEGKSNQDTAIVQQGISELQNILTTISTESDAYEDCLNAIENGNKELADLQKSLSDAKLTAQIEDIEYRKEINARTQSDLQTTKQYYEELKTYVESIQGTEYYDGKVRDFEKKLYSAEKAYNEAYVKAYTEDVKAQIAILDDIKADFEDNALGDKWYLEQLTNIIMGIDNADVAQAFEAQLTKAKEQVDKNAEAVEKSILQAAQKYQGAIEYFRNGETLAGEDSLIINDLEKQREQVQNVIKGMQALRDRGFTDAYLNDAVESLSVQDGSRQKAITALLGLTDEQIKQELQDYEGLKADMLELARVENDVQSQEIADSAVLTANDALSQAIAEAYKIGRDTADSFNRGIIDGLGTGINAQQALTAQGIDTLKSATTTGATTPLSTKADSNNTTVVVNVAGTEVIRKTVDGMMRENLITGGNNLHI